MAPRSRASRGHGPRARAVGERQGGGAGAGRSGSPWASLPAFASDWPAWASGLLASRGCGRGAGRSTTSSSPTTSRSSARGSLARDRSRCAKRPSWRRRPRSAGGGRSCSCRATGATGARPNVGRSWRTSWRTCAAAISSAGLAAQLGLALHFYHPLAHWLAARLRLEQELAADAWGARLSGGKTSYLATLAQMALRRDGRDLDLAGPCVSSHLVAPLFGESKCCGTPTDPPGLADRRVRVLYRRRPRRARAWPVRAARPGGMAAAERRFRRHPLPAPRSPAPMRAGSRRLTTWPSCRPTPRWSSPCGPGFCFSAERSVRLLSNRHRRPGAERLAGSSIPRTSSSSLVFWEGNPEPPGQNRESADRTVPSGIVLRMSKPQDWKTRRSGRLPVLSQEVRHDGQAYIGPTDLYPRAGPLSPPTTGRWSRPGRPAPRADRGPQRPCPAPSLGRSLEKGRQGPVDAGPRHALAAPTARSRSAGRRPRTCSRNPAGTHALTRSRRCSRRPNPTRSRSMPRED